MGKRRVISVSRLQSTFNRTEHDKQAIIGDSPYTRNGARVRSPSPIMTPVQTYDLSADIARHL